MKNNIKKTFNFRTNDLGIRVLFIAEVTENKFVAGNNYTLVLTRENFYSKKSFLIRLPQLLQVWGDRLQIKKRISNKFKKIRLEEI